MQRLVPTVRWFQVGSFFGEFVWVLTGHSSFLPRAKNVHMRQIGNSKLVMGVIVKVNGCLSFFVTLR